MEIKQKKLPENTEKKSFAYRKASAGRVLSHAPVAVTPVIDSQEESGNYSALPPPCARPSTLQSSNCFAYLPIPLAQLDTFNARKNRRKHIFSGSKDAAVTRFTLEPSSSSPPEYAKFFCLFFRLDGEKTKGEKFFQPRALLGCLETSITKCLWQEGASQREELRLRCGKVFRSSHGMAWSSLSPMMGEKHTKKDSDEECLSAERKKLFPRSAQKSEVSSRTFFLLL